MLGKLCRNSKECIKSGEYAMCYIKIGNETILVYKTQNK